MKKIISDELWEEIEPLLPKDNRRPENRKALTGIVFILMAGIPWEKLAPKMGHGSGTAYLQRLRDWQKAGVWLHLQRLLEEKLDFADKIDWARAIADSSSTGTGGAMNQKRAVSIRSRHVGRRTPFTSPHLKRAPGRHFFREHLE